MCCAVTTTDGEGVGRYVCGPTVYDDAHLGHGRTYVCIDILGRIMTHWHQMHVELAMNVQPHQTQTLRHSLRHSGRQPVSQSDAHSDRQAATQLVGCMIIQCPIQTESIHNTIQVTDIDDKIVARAAERGEDPIELARRFEER